MIGRVSRLQLLLVLYSTVILGFESRGTRDHILLSQIRDFLFRRLLRITELRWKYSTPPLHRNDSCESVTCPFMARCGQQTEHTPERFVCCYLRIRYHGNACSPKTVVQQRPISRCQENALSEGPPNTRSYSGFQASCHNPITQCQQLMSWLLLLTYRV
jgi:hypothetical protein